METWRSYIRPRRRVKSSGYPTKVNIEVDRVEYGTCQYRASFAESWSSRSTYRFAAFFLEDLVNLWTLDRKQFFHDIHKALSTFHRLKNYA